MVEAQVERENAMEEMTILQAINLVLGSAWQMITSIKYPGTEIPIATIMVGAFTAAFSIRIIAYALSMSVHVGDALPMERKKDK